MSCQVWPEKISCKFEHMMKTNEQEDFIMSYQFYVPTRTLFGTGKLNELHTQTMPGKKAMVVISNGKSMKETGTLYRVLKELAYVGVETAISGIT